MLGYFVREGGMVGSVRERVSDAWIRRERERCWNPLSETERYVVGFFQGEKETKRDRDRERC